MNAMELVVGIFCKIASRLSVTLGKLLISLQYQLWCPLSAKQGLKLFRVLRAAVIMENLRVPYPGLRLRTKVITFTKK